MFAVADAFLMCELKFHNRDGGPRRESKDQARHSVLVFFLHWCCYELSAIFYGYLYRSVSIPLWMTLGDRINVFPAEALA